MSADSAPAGAMPAETGGAADVQAWFGSAGAPRFLSEFWRRRMALQTLPPKAFSSLLSRIGPLDPVRMAPRARGGVEGWMASEHTAHSVLPFDGGSVEKALRIGATLYFIDVDLPELVASAAQFMGVSAARVTASLFLTPAGGGASWHFDANENFTVQLTGAKQWAVGPQPCVPGAPVGYVVGLEPPPQLAGRLGSVDREPAHHVTLEPGALLYVPRGVLHRTGAGLQSWSLNLACRPEFS